MLFSCHPPTKVKWAAKSCGNLRENGEGSVRWSKEVDKVHEFPGNLNVNVPIGVNVLLLVFVDYFVCVSASVSVCVFAVKERKKRKKSFHSTINKRLSTNNNQPFAINRGKPLMYSATKSSDSVTKRSERTLCLKPISSRLANSSTCLLSSTNWRTWNRVWRMTTQRTEGETV